MKEYIKRFCLRGMMFAWGGPFIMAIVWIALHHAGIIEQFTVNEAVLGILSMTVMAFIAAGISIVYQIERLPKAMAWLIQMAVLYVDYLGFYLLNGWIPLNRVWMFTLIFAAGFLVIWFAIYILIRIRVSRINKAIRHS